MAKGRKEAKVKKSGPRASYSIQAPTLDFGAAGERLALGGLEGYELASRHDPNGACRTYLLVRQDHTHQILELRGALPRAGTLFLTKTM